MQLITRDPTSRGTSNGLPRVIYRTHVGFRINRYARDAWSPRDSPRNFNARDEISLTAERCYLLSVTLSMLIIVTVQRVMKNAEASCIQIQIQRDTWFPSRWDSFKVFVTVFIPRLFCSLLFFILARAIVTARVSACGIFSRYEWDGWQRVRLSKLGRSQPGNACEKKLWNVPPLSVFPNDRGNWREIVKLAAVNHSCGQSVSFFPPAASQN
jgi:hypothetical protein